MAQQGQRLARLQGEQLILTQHNAGEAAFAHGLLAGEVTLEQGLVGGHHGAAQGGGEAAAGAVKFVADEVEQVLGKYGRFGRIPAEGEVGKEEIAAAAAVGSAGRGLDEDAGNGRCRADGRFSCLHYAINDVKLARHRLQIRHGSVASSWCKVST
jgi:hypothetical protein